MGINMNHPNDCKISLPSLIFFAHVANRRCDTFIPFLIPALPHSVGSRLLLEWMARLCESSPGLKKNTAIQAEVPKERGKERSREEVTCWKDFACKQQSVMTQFSF